MRHRGIPYVVEKEIIRFILRNTINLFATDVDTPAVHRQFQATGGRYYLP